MARSKGRPSRIWAGQPGEGPVSPPAPAGDDRRKRVRRTLTGVIIAIILLLIPPCAMRHCCNAGDNDGFRIVERTALRVAPAGEPARKSEVIVKRRTTAPVSRRAKKIYRQKPAEQKTGRDIKPITIDKEPESARKSESTKQEGAIAAPAGDNKKRKTTADSSFGKPKYYDFGTKIELDPPPVTR